MTEKRFSYKLDEIFDEGNHFAYALSKENAEDIVELLNELNKEKRRLKNELNLSKLNLKEKNEGFDKIHKMYMEQIEKNNKLKQKIEALKMEIAELRESEKDNYNISDGLW